MSQLMMRFLFGGFGTVVVAIVLASVFRIRRRHRARAGDTGAGAESPRERGSQSGWAQNLIVSILASVISGIALFFIYPLLAPVDSPVVDYPYPAPLIIQASQTRSNESTIGTDSVEETSLPAEPGGTLADPDSTLDSPQTLATSTDTVIAPEPLQAESGIEAVVDILISGNTAEWRAAVVEPISFRDAVPADGRLMIAGASTSSVVELSPLAVPAFLSNPKPRIQLCGASVTAVLPLVMTPPGDLSMNARPVLVGAETVTTVHLEMLVHVGFPVASLRPLIVGASTTDLIKLEKPEMRTKSN